MRSGDAATSSANFDLRSLQAQAARVTRFCVVDSDVGPAYLLPGDWIVTFSTTGKDEPVRLAMQHKDFRKLFMPRDDAAAALLQCHPEELHDGYLPFPTAIDSPRGEESETDGPGKAR